MDKAAGMRVGLLPLPALVFTEREAIKELTWAEAVPVSAGSSDGEIATTLVIRGSNKEVEKAWNIVDNIKGEQRIRIESMQCKSCFVGESSCQFFGANNLELPKWMSKIPG